MIKYNKLQPLQKQAIKILQDHPEISIHDFVKLIGKRYQHAGSLMSFARRQLGYKSSATKVDKTMALLYLDMPHKGPLFKDQLGVKDCRASELRKLANERLSLGKRPTSEAIQWAQNLEDSPQDPDTAAEPHPPERPKTKAARGSAPAVKAVSTGSGEMSVQSVERKPRDPEDLIRASGLNPEEWVVGSQTINVWEMGAKHPETGEILVEPLFQTKVRLEPVGGTQGLMAAITDMIEDLRSNPPTLPCIEPRKVLDGHLVEIAIPDLHLGKYASRAETGEDYSPEIACEIFADALEDLINQATNAYPIERIIFPIGNDFLTADNSANTTTRGTAQDVSGNFEQHFALGWKLLREGIEKLRTVAPVDVVIVPGNHDTVASFAIGQLLGAIYASTKDVTVHHETLQPRKYISYGRNLLGFAHGHLEKGKNLPLLMATEAPIAWGKTLHREIHVGHLHHTRDTHYMGANEVDGVTIRVIPSLSGCDRWHAAKGYRSQRAAMALIYHPSKGPRAIFRYSILEALKIPVPEAA